MGDTNEALEQHSNASSQSSNTPGNGSGSGSSRSWTREDIEDLFNMSFSGYRVFEMCRVLKRSRQSVLRALRRIQGQQAMFNSISDVANAHNLSVTTLEKRLKDPLYYIPLKKDDAYPLVVLSTVIFGLVSMYGYLCYTP